MFSKIRSVTWTLLLLVALLVTACVAPKLAHRPRRRQKRQRQRRQPAALKWRSCFPGQLPMAAGINSPTRA